VALASLGGQTNGTNTSVNVMVPTGTFRTGNTVIVSIRSSPTRPVKAWELTMNYNKNVLRADIVYEGDIFLGHPTFFSAGIIDNSIGQIKNLYNLIVGQGNITAPGNLITVSFTAIGYGNCAISISNVGLTNESIYIPITVSNSSMFIYSIYDINYDKTVGMLDIVSVASHYGEIGNAGWIIQDVFKDGKINIMDLVQVSIHWGNY
jgi:hypothetical protein